MAEINEQMRDDAAAFVLGAMSELEAQAFRREMMKNCELGRYVERLEQVGDVLLSQAPPVDVPDSLGMSIMAEAKRDLEVQELVASPRAGARAEAPKKSLFDRILKPALAIGAAAIVAVGAFVVGQNAGEEQGPAAPTVAAEFKPNTDKPVSGTIQSIDGGATVEVSGLSPDIGSDVYELWIQRGDKVTRSTLFTVDSEGNGRTSIGEDISDADNIMITREPAGGTDVATGDVLATAAI